MPKVEINVPKSIMMLPAEDRDAILGVLAKAVRLPAEMVTYHPVGGDELDVWAPDQDPLMAHVEDALYRQLNQANLHMMADTIAALDLPTRGIILQKALEGNELIKSKNNGKRKISDLVRATKEKREELIAYLQEMNPFSRAQMNKLDKIMRQKLPNYAKIAEDFATRAAFIGKIRNTAEQEAFQTMGALIDRFPSTIKEATHRGIVLTLPEKAQADRERRKVIVLPLTDWEARAVEHASLHAGEKITEVTERHITGIKQIIIRAQKERKSPLQLAQDLYDAYGEQNRDWRRVAITELAIAANDAYLAGCEEGATLVGMGAENACKHCKALVIGKEFTVTHELPKSTEEYAMTHMWVGKSNYGRRVAEYIPCAPVHPHCKCRWHRRSRFYKTDGAGKQVLRSTAELIQEELARRGLPPDPNLK